MGKETDVVAAPIEVAFEFCGVGGVDISIRLGAETVLLGGLCYGTDAVGDFIRLALAIATGAREAQCSFDLEPHELRVVLRRQLHDPEVVDLTVVELADWRSPLPEAVQRASAQCAFEDLAFAIERAANTILETHGAQGYREVWGWEFPARAVVALKAALALPPAEITLGPAFPGSEPLVTYHILGSDEAED